MGYTSDVGFCNCGDCARGVVTYGHCVDIDGDWWHECPALLAEVAREKDN